MAYEKYTWTDGEVITAQKLNHMENGIEDAGSGGGGSGTFIVKPDHEEGGTTYYDKTWQELYDAMYSGQHCVIWINEIFSQSEYYIHVLPISFCGYDENDSGYMATGWQQDVAVDLNADSANSLLYHGASPTPTPTPD